MDRKPTAGSGGKPWYTTAYRRAVIDMHIPDWDDRFLSRVDVDQYVAMLAKARAQSIVAYAMSHVGLFNYPTKVGRQHKGPEGAEPRPRDHRRLPRARDRGAALQQPDLRPHLGRPAPRLADADAVDGKPHGEGGRHGLVCPNSPYREYVRAWVEEECRLFDFEGIRFDMTFWPAVCYCEPARSGSPPRWGARSRPRSTGSTSGGSRSSAGARRGWGSSPRSPPGTVRTLRPGGERRAPVVDLSRRLAAGRRMPPWSRRTTSSRAISTATRGRARSCASCSRT